jgi:anti-sigma B factor antagonist
MPESLETGRLVADDVLNVTVSEVIAGTTLCVVAGEIDLLTGPGLRQRLTDALNAGPGHLVIDLSGVKLLASIGLSILVEILDVQEAAGYHLALVVGKHRAVVNVLKTTGLDQVFDLHDAVAGALEACSSGIRAAQLSATDVPLTGY